MPLCSAAIAVRLQTMMASHGEDTGATKSEEQGERKTTAVSFGFTKTVSKFKPAADTGTKREEKDYLTGIDRNELQRYASYANANAY